MSRHFLVVGLVVGVLIGLVVGYYLPHVPSYVSDTNVPSVNGHYDLYEEIYEIKDRLLVKITDSAFPPTGIRECIWFELA